MATPAPNRRLLIVLMALGVLLVLVSAGAGYVYAYRGRMAPRTRISGVPVGHLTQAEALAAVTARENSFLESKVTLTYPGGDLATQPKLLGLQFDTETAIRQAYGNADSQPLSQRIRQLSAAPFQARAFAVSLHPVSDAGSAYLRSRLPAAVEQQAIETTISFVPNNVEIKPGIAGHLVDLSALSRSLADAYASGNSHIPLELQTFQPTVSTANAQAALTQARALLGAPWTVQAGTQTIAVTDQDLASLLAASVVPATGGQPATLSLTVRPAAVQALVAAWAKQTDRPATNALLGTVNGAIAVTQPDVDGLALDQAAATTALEAAIAEPPTNHAISVPTAVAKAAIRADTLASSGISQLIGTATTDFVGSPVNRVYNITVGQKSINGILIADGAQFSTLDSLGPIDQAHGYKPELSIINNRTVPEDGGGLCQVSTTLFRAALNAGLPITARANHAYRVGYYEAGVGPGLDATIYSPSPDFKWKNDTGHPVYVESHIVGTKITFELYGTSDGRTAQISAPDIISESPPGDPIYSNTDTLPKGTTKQVEHPHPGAVVTVTYTVTRGGQTVATQVFKSNYKPWPAQFLVGTS